MISKTILTENITPKEATQFCEMMNWASNDQEINRMEIDTFKQFHKTNKTYKTIYRISTQDWYDNAWMLIEGEGMTLTEAMQNYSRIREVKRGSNV